MSHNTNNCQTNGSCSTSKNHGQCSDQKNDCGCPMEKMMCETMCVAKCAKKELMKQKLMKLMDAKWGDKMDKVAALIVDELEACWHMNMDKTMRKHGAMEKMKNIMMSK